MRQMLSFSSRSYKNVVVPPSFSFKRSGCRRQLSVYAVFKICLLIILLLFVCVSVLSGRLVFDDLLNNSSSSKVTNDPSHKEYEDVLTLPFPNCPRPIMTLSTSFKPTLKKADLYRRTLKNWANLLPFVQPVLFKVANEEANEDLLNEARKLGWMIEDVPEMGVNSTLPVLKSIFLKAAQINKSPFYGFANGDILFPSGLIETLCFLHEGIPWARYLLTARRINVNLTYIPDSFANDQMVNMVRKKGRLFIPNAIDLFVVSANSYPWHKVPPFVIGRIVFDNWLIANGLLNNISIVDITRTVPLLHQTDDEGNNAGRDKTKDVNDQQRNVNMVADKLALEMGRVTCAPYVTMWDAFKKPVLMHGDLTADKLCVKFFRRYNLTDIKWQAQCPICKPITNPRGEW